MNKRLLWLLAASIVALTGCGPAAQTASQGASSDAGNGEASTPIPAPFPVVAEPYPEDAKKFSTPWERKDTQIVIDAYSGNSIDWNKMAADGRVSGVIHRSSIGLNVDTQYQARALIAKQRGYLWGAYHLGKPGDPIAQAKLFLKTVGDPTNVLMILDLEDTSSSAMMNVPNAKIFMNYIFAETGKMPVVYANHSVTKELNDLMKNDPTFAMSRLWYARFRSDIPDFPAGIWSTYFLWQFSSEINCSKTGSCLYNVPGTASDMDINVYYGSKAALTYEWSL